MAALDTGDAVVGQFRDLLIPQWRTQPQFLQLSTGLGALIREGVFVPLDEIEQGLSLETARGPQLDRLGMRLGFARPEAILPISSITTPLFGLRDSSGAPVPDTRTRGFDQAALYSTDPLISGLTGVSDDWYRRMLRGRATAIVTRGTKVEIEAAGGAMGSPTVATLGTPALAIELEITEAVEDFYDIIVTRQNLERLFGVVAGVTVVTSRVSP